MRTLGVIAALILGGCAVTPAQLREQGRVFEKTLTQPPDKAVYCVARKAENAGDMWWGVFTPTVRPGPAPGSMEIIIGAVLVADLLPAGPGSLAKIYAAPHVIDLQVNRYVGAFDGC